ncbi:MAG: hypothetical protein A3C93_06525 [Candidatus Lloydbacteria bacterium RIFCSPHIGHO2_02_FULL_54_17]|uniref:Glycosyl hydrolase family 32 N-terminal domain-containing protein n=1 Tax=Candidatus Lloydbacteria bacterium RIFCSPHIGHO2_02_FULL_54_17 TaxID=1798664 RepID=A0A1G2DC31_9BACT|nr:MAG: hypothetical protein A2762_05300 [Candidatus Lloydbacteria bacterium RIFCSPHIGHO2_01_FULL_54_11]OGZ11156.1 MAG: hypothetical protein A3C93_06525 [Candidatus Lloydbacteria bacterium RIFCSPHIGHO2_02_FULL_54_17]OGZ14989.1 MAG: hypothetical protein A2948_00895 [Candidatus Lloydbacteria bacterium RIFCSPLOWO2_01_FULL_54_18]
MKKYFFIAIIVVAVFILVSSSEKILVTPQLATATSSWVEYRNNPIIKYKDVLPDILWNDPSVIKEGDTYKMWLSGGDPSADELEIKIYYAISRDGINWSINKDPVLSPSEGTWDGASIEVPTVLRVGNTYHMYYAANNAKVYEANYSIGHATSNDGISWTKDPNNPIIKPQPDPLKWGFYTTSEPAVAYFKNKFYLYYVSAKSNYPEPGSPFGIMVATSKDGSTFTDNQIAHTLTPSYDSTKYRGYSTPAAYVKNGVVYLYYQVVYDPDGWEPVAISSAKSTDGIYFQEVETNIFTKGGGDWKDHSVGQPTVLQDGKSIKMWFAGQTGTFGFSNFGYGIGYATKQ